MKRRFFGILVLVVIVGLLGWQVYRRATTSPKSFGYEGKAPPVAVEVAAIRVATIRDVGFFTGTLLPRSQFVIAPKIGGRLQRLYVNIGEVVERGQLIAEVDDDEYVQQVEQARAELEVAKANVAERESALEVARRELDRAQVLREQKIASESELDEAQAQFKAAEAKYNVALAQVDQKEAALKGAQVRLSYTKIAASWHEGDKTRIVGERFVDEGAMLRANDPIVSILDISSLTAVLHIVERDYSKMRAGQEVIVTTDAFPSMHFAGEVARVAPILKETSRQARVEVTVPNPDLILKPGMFIRAKLEFAKHDNAKVVSLSALTRRGQEQGVFVADLQNVTAHFVAVKLGITEGDMAEVTEPPLDGYVVVLGQHLLEDGGAITVPGVSRAGELGRPATGVAAPGTSE